jgi:hypothetical protein
MYILKGISSSDKESIQGGNRTLLKKKLEVEVNKWNELLHLGKEDHRFNQGICCTLKDIIEVLGL